MEAKEIDRILDGLDEISGYSCEQMSLFDNDVFIRGIANESMTAIRELKAENDRLKQEKADAVKRINETAEAIPKIQVNTESDGIYMSGKYWGMKDALDIINSPSI